MAKLNFKDKPNFKPGETKTFFVRFTTPKGHSFPLFSWGIKILEWWFDASHVQLMWDAKKFDETLIYEASGTNVHFVGSKMQSRDLWHIEHVFEVTVPAEAGWKTIKWVMAHAGLKYGMKEIVGILTVKVACLFGKKIKNPFGDGTESQFCSEMIGFIMRDAWGYKIQEDLDVAGPKLIFNKMYEASKKFDNVTYRKDLSRKVYNG